MSIATCTECYIHFCSIENISVAMFYMRHPTNQLISGFCRWLDKEFDKKKETETNRKLEKLTNACTYTVDVYGGCMTFSMFWFLCCV